MALLSPTEHDRSSPTLELKRHSDRRHWLASPETMQAAMARSFFGIPFVLFTGEGELLIADSEAERLVLESGLSWERLEGVCLSLADSLRETSIERPSSEIWLRRRGRRTRLRFLLERVLYGEEYLNALLMLGFPGFCAPFGLTSRELEIVLAIRGGLSNREIGESLYISVDTVKRHISNIFQKTDARNRTELLFRLQQHLLSWRGVR